MPKAFKFFPHVKNEPYRPGKEYVFAPENGAVVNTCRPLLYALIPN
jgi:hypothetical protein